MQWLTETARERAPWGVFTRPDVACWAGGSPDRQFNLIKRALASGEVLHLRRGLYHLAPRFLRENPDPLVLAQRIYGPSYLSLETALQFHGWIPEAVYSITSVSMDRSREFETPIVNFSFAAVPQKVLYAQVARVERHEGGDAARSFLMATPLKALADYVYVHKQDWRGMGPASLRALPSTNLALLKVKWIKTALES